MDIVVVDNTQEASVNLASDVIKNKRQEAEFLNSIDKSIAQADRGQTKDAFASFDNITGKLESRKKAIG